MTGWQRAPIAGPGQPVDHVWRIVAVLAVYVVWVSVFAPVALFSWDGGWGVSAPHLAVAMLLVLLRRRLPLVVLAVLCLASAVKVPYQAGAVIVLVSVAARYPLWVCGVAMTGLDLTITRYLVQAGLYEGWVGPDSASDQLGLHLGFLLTLTAAVALGRLIARYRAVAQAAALGEVALRREADLRIARVRASERGQVARELHARLADSLAALQTYAATLAHRPAVDADQRRFEAGVVLDAARQALATLREVLGVLRAAPATDLAGPVEVGRPAAHARLTEDSDSPRHTVQVLGLAVLVALAEMGVADTHRLLLTREGLVEYGLWLPVSLILLLYRRRFPQLVLAALCLLGYQSLTATGAMAVALLSFAARRGPWWHTAAGGVLVCVASLTQLVIDSPKDGRLVGICLGFVIAIGFVIGVGELLGRTREATRAATAGEEAAAHAHDLAGEQARAEERAAIARDMHDVLGHRLSLVTMQAGGLAYRKDLPADDVLAGARLIEATAVQARSELGEVLGLLDPGHPPASARVPDGGDLERLVAEARGAGEVRLDVRVDLRRLAARRTWPGHHVLRIVQEGLTNARKHAPGAAVDVRVVGAPGEGVHVDVTNGPGPDDAQAPVSGFGLIGLAERAELAGGTIEHGPMPDGGHRLIAELPWPAEPEVLDLRGSARIGS